MGFWIYMFIMDLLIPIIMILFGRAFLKKAPSGAFLLYGRSAKKHRNKLLVTLRASIVSELPLTSLARRTPFSQAKSEVLTANTTIKQKAPSGAFLFYGRSAQTPVEHPMKKCNKPLC